MLRGWTNLINYACKSGTLVVLLVLTASAEPRHEDRGGARNGFHHPPSKLPTAFLPLHRPKRRGLYSSASKSIMDCDSEIPILFESDRLLVEIAWRPSIGSCHFWYIVVGQRCRHGCRIVKSLSRGRRFQILRGHFREKTLQKETRIGPRVYGTIASKILDLETRPSRRGT
jgi:hypothetical protein